MKAANYAPVYAAIYPELAEIAREHGYALAIHGTLGRDMDLIGVPWITSANDPQAVVDAFIDEFNFCQVGEPEVKEHGRKVWTVCLAFGECFLDVSFMPRLIS